jgi:hypothetical protein
MRDIKKFLCLWFFFSFGTLRKITAIDVSAGDQNRRSSDADHEAVRK